MTFSYFRQPSSELPEEPYDGRSLFERLKEQRDKKDLEFEESHKLSEFILDLFVVCRCEWFD